MKSWIVVIILAVTGGAFSADVQGGGGSGTGPRVVPERVSSGEERVGTKSQASALTLSNPGPGPLRIESLLTSGIDFSETDDCGHTLASGSRCTIQVFFQPATIGPRLGQLSVIASVPVQPQSIPLSGTGL
jgi:hypothetical protein